MRIYDLYREEFYRGLKLRHQLMFLSLATFAFAMLLLVIATVLGLVIWSIVAVVNIFENLLATCFLWAGLLSIEVPLLFMLCKGLNRLMFAEFFTGRKERC